MTILVPGANKYLMSCPGCQFVVPPGFSFNRNNGIGSRPKSTFAAAARYSASNTLLQQQQAQAQQELWLYCYTGYTNNVELHRNGAAHDNLLKRFVDKEKRDCGTARN